MHVRESSIQQEATSKGPNRVWHQSLRYLYRDYRGDIC